MNSPKFLNYETRPLKFTERKMLLSAFNRIINHYQNNYQYIGFGGISFTDFKLFHKELHINEMCSIEGGNFSIEKLQFNCPYSFINIYQNNSTNILSELELDKRTIVWLDYDSVLDNYFFDDISVLFSKLPVGSIYLMTCNRELKLSETREEYTIEQFKEKFGNNIPYNLRNSDFIGGNNYKTIRILLNLQIKKTLSERLNSTFEDLEFNQLFNILYQENRGAKMFTYGGLIAEKGSKVKDDILLDDFEFISLEETPYKLEIPNFTRREIDLVDNHLSTKEIELINKNIITQSELDKYKRTYKYLPNFFDVRL
ncbi:MAG: hypothetical protein LBP34_08725 [Flavobacteriaceae bacterium]|jgi:hypothetical protein|nr:hypothetical protein [Flavobacteriaceae bacterium]